VIPVPEYDGGGTRTPQSVQSVPKGHELEVDIEVDCVLALAPTLVTLASLALPGPPWSSQIPLFSAERPPSLQVFEHSVA